MHRHLTALALLTLSTTALAIPLEINHQGRMFNASGTPIDSPEDVALKLYDAPSGGTPLWEETHTAVEFDQGYYSLQVGSQTALDSAVFDGSTLYFGLTIGAGAEMPQRLPVVSVPYAIRAGDADRAAISDDLAPGLVIDAAEIRVNGTTVIDNTGTIDGSSIDGASDTLVDLGCGADQIALFDGTNWGCVANTHDAAAIVGGTFSIARLPVGTGSSEVSAGDHTHTAADVGALPFNATAADIGALPLGTTAADIGALPLGTTAADIGALPLSTTAADIGGLPNTTTASDIGALPDTATPADIGALADTTTAADIGGVMASGGTFSGDVAVQGTITVADSSGSACNSGNEGEIRWTGDNFEGCTGTAWVVLARGTIGQDSSNPGVSCKDILDAGSSTGDGNYWIDPDNGGSFQVYCDMTTNGGGWTQVMTVAPTDGTSVGYNNQTFWTTNAEFGNFSNRDTTDYKSDAAFRLAGTQLLIQSVNTSGGVLGWRRWPMSSTRTFDSFFTTGIVPVHATDSCETGNSDAVSLGSTNAADDIIRQGTCLYADVNPSASGQGDTIRLTTIAGNSTDNRMSGFASCIDCGTPWQGGTYPYMGLDRAACNTTLCYHNAICRMPSADCRGNYCSSTYSTTSCGSTWNSWFFVR